MADRIAWPAKKAANDDATATGAVTATSMIALAASSVGRWGRAVRVARIEPVEYSLATMEHAEHADSELRQEEAAQAVGRRVDAGLLSRGEG